MLQSNTRLCSLWPIRSQKSHRAHASRECSCKSPPGRCSRMAALFLQQPCGLGRRRRKPNRVLTVRSLRKQRPKSKWPPPRLLTGTIRRVRSLRMKARLPAPQATAVKAAKRSSLTRPWLRLPMGTMPGRPMAMPARDATWQFWVAASRKCSTPVESGAG